MVFELQGVRCLVTGATGLIGQAVSSRLLAEGAEVRAFVRNPSKGRRLAEAGAGIVQGDIADAAATRRAVEGCSVVFHLAAVLTDFRPISFYRRVNVDATRWLAEAALATGIKRFVYASTVWTYGLNAGEGTDEGSPQKKSACITQTPNWRPNRCCLALPGTGASRWSWRSRARSTDPRICTGPWARSS
jgi:nucleoside-diphosphate-sugar epimerase